jgi:lipoprotein-anchoring transpeptidase ErfK/SrfK
MKDSELGQRLSGGCQRQADADATFMWDFAQVGTKVVVL